jgi:hypothetical protein
MLAAIAAGALVTAGFANAATPEQVSFANDWGDNQYCPGFTIAFYGHNDIAGTIWRNDAGDPIKALFHRRGYEVNTNTSTGKSVTVKRADNVYVDFVAGTVKRTGANQIGTLPGQGIGFHDSGLWYEDFDGNLLKAAGPHDNPDIAFCEMLG